MLTRRGYWLQKGSTSDADAAPRGARSGKSALALQLASAGTSPVIFLATGEASDDEMATKIALHRSQRPASWATLEEPVEVEKTFRDIADGTTVVVDCLTLWVANLLAVVRRRCSGRDSDRCGGTLRRQARAGLVVSNEVGSGIVPTDNILSRRYRDLLGRVNIAFA